MKALRLCGTMPRMPAPSSRSLLHASIGCLLLAVTAFAGACGKGETGGGGSTTTTGAGGGDTWPQCHTCLQTQCATEIAACDSECIALQACLDSVCLALSAQDASDEEGKCQVYCQSLHAGAKQKHINLVNCTISTAYAGGCMPPCALATYDWDQCRADADANACKSELAACNGDADCKAYNACAGSCASAADCEACGTAGNGAAGLALAEAYFACVEKSCLPEFWLPALN